MGKPDQLFGVIDDEAVQAVLNLAKAAVRIDDDTDAASRLGFLDTDAPGSHDHFRWRPMLTIACPRPKARRPPIERFELRSRYVRMKIYRKAICYLLTI